MNTYNTPYDDVFRTLLTDCKQLIIPVINEMFGTNYGPDTAVELLQNEIYLKQQNGEEEKKVTDSSFYLIVNREKTRYHVECQSSVDGSMLIRMFEYDSQIALFERATTVESLDVRLPNSAILMLRHNSRTPNEFKITIHAQNNSLSYSVPLLKVKDYDIDEMFEKKLFFLIPFYIFKWEGRLASIDKDEEKIKNLSALYCDIARRLDELVESGEINEYINKTIRDMAEKVVSNLASKHENVVKEVTNVMGGQVLDYEAKRILNLGRSEGIIEGAKKGTYETLMGLVKDGCISIAEAAKRVGLTEDEFANVMSTWKF